MFKLYHRNMKFAPNFCLFSKNKISPDYLVKFCFNTSLLEKSTSLLLCLSTASTMPMADTNIITLVPPAETNGSGMPVGGIESIDSVCCTKILRQLYSVISHLFFYSSVKFIRCSHLLTDKFLFFARRFVYVFAISSVVCSSALIN